MLLWLALHVGAVSGAAALFGPKPQRWDPVPQHLATPFQTGDVARRRGGGGAGRGQGPPLNIDLSVWGRGQTELQWYGDITVGTPPRKFKLIFDTGAGMMLIADKNCTTCGSHTLYDSALSSTYSPLPGWRTTAAFGSQGGGTSGSSELQSANCTVVTDAVGMAGRSVASEFLTCDGYSSGLRIQAPDGLFGMPSTPPGNWFLANGSAPEYKHIYWHLVETGQIPGPEFAFSLVSDRPGRAGVLTLGGTDRSQYVPATLRAIPLNWPLSESRTRWVVDVRGARVDGFTLANSTDAVTLVDTGGSTIVTPDRNTTRELYGRMSDQIQPIDDFGSWGAPCDVLDRAARDVTFTLGSAAQKVDVVVKKKYLNVGEFAGRPGICQGVYTDPERVAREPIHGRPAWIFGSPLLRSYYTVWDGVDRTLAFATPAHRDLS